MPDANHFLRGHDTYFLYCNWPFHCDSVHKLLKPLALKNGRRLADKNSWSHCHSHNGKTQGMIDITLMSKTNANWIITISDISSPKHPGKRTTKLSCWIRIPFISPGTQNVHLRQWSFSIKDLSRSLEEVTSAVDCMVSQLQLIASENAENSGHYLSRQFLLGCSNQVHGLAVWIIH